MLFVISALPEEADIRYILAKLAKFHRRPGGSTLSLGPPPWNLPETVTSLRARAMTDLESTCETCHVRAIEFLRY